MKRLLSTVLAMAMLITLFASVVSGESPKVPSEWARESVEKAQELLITEREYDYTAPVSREDFCEIIYNYIKICGTEFTVDSAEPFADTDNEKIAALYSLGIINGKSETKFAPNDTLTREEAATILSRTIDKTWDAKYVPNRHVTFSDYWDISDWAEKSIVEMYNLGIINGMGVKNDGRVVVSPLGKLTAEQAITMVVRLWEKTTAETFADKMNVLMPENQNYMFSPISVKMALMMAANGASGETQQEILDTLGVSDIEEYNESTKQMIKTLSEFDILKLNIANSIWINSDVTPQRFSTTFSDKVTDVFGATSEIVNNSNATSKINSWVNDKTEGKIPTIITEDKKDFAAMLINAVYFKARWSKEFHPYYTKPDTFTQRDGEEKNIDFMNETEYYAYASQDGVKIVKLPYRQGRVEYDDEGNVTKSERVDGVDVNMYLMMSENEFSPEAVLDCTELESLLIDLYMPKFELNYSVGINKMLKKLGINRAFDKDNAEFQKMVTEENMWIDDALHKTYIKVDEEGTEAAAVTAIAMSGTGMPQEEPEPIVVKFNKPFTFVIRDDVSGEILFMGEYAFAE